MSKAASGLFSGTIGSISYITGSYQVGKVISNRIKEFDLREHPRKKSLTSKQRKQINAKIKSRTASKDQYKQYDSDKRFAERRKKGVNNFWSQEQVRILTGQKPTRNWSEEQKNAIMVGERPKYKGKTIQGHHTYSASKYPHLANKGELIYPVTFEEHLYGWHGGNFKNSLPGTPIRQSNYYVFGGTNGK